MLSRPAAYVVYPTATLAGVTAAWLLFRDAPAEPSGENELPHRCAALADGAPDADATMHLAPTEPLVVGVVADARGATPATLDNLEAARVAFREARVDLVLTLGGMGATGEELAAVYGALAEGSEAPVVAIPGDREPLFAHREAIASLGARHPVVDGSAIRAIVAGDTTIATFPGIGEVSQIVAGSEGCYYESGDADMLATWLQRRAGTKVWAGYAPPRQRGSTASDLVGGVHIGDPSLGRAMRASEATLALHGLVNEASLGEPSGERILDEDAGPIALAPGPVEAMPVLGRRRGASFGAALIVRVDPPRIEWERLSVAADDSR